MGKECDRPFLILNHISCIAFSFALSIRVQTPQDFPLQTHTEGYPCSGHGCLCYIIYVRYLLSLSKIDPTNTYPRPLYIPDIWVSASHSYTKSRLNSQSNNHFRFIPDRLHYSILAPSQLLSNPSDVNSI